MTTIYYTPEAYDQAARVDAEWREHARSNPELFGEQLVWAQNKAAELGTAYRVYREVRGEAVRRVYMKRADHHLYYTCQPAEDAITVVAVWGARRKKGPRL